MTENTATTTTTLDELGASCEAKAIAINDLIHDGKQEDAVKELAKLKEMVKEYNDGWRLHQYDQFLASDVPVKTAIERLFIRRHQVKAKTNTDTGALTSVRIVEVAKYSTNDCIDLVSFEEYSPKKVFVNAQWRYWVENFTTMMGAMICRECGKTGAADYYLSHVKLSAKAIEYGKSGESKSTIGEELQRIVDAILMLPKLDKEGNPVVGKDGNPINSIKITKADIAYIQRVMAKETAALDVSLPSDKDMRRLITKAIYRNLTGEEYGFIFEERKVEETTPDPDIPGFSKAYAMNMKSE